MKFGGNSTILIQNTSELDGLTTKYLLYLITFLLTYTSWKVSKGI